MDLATKFENAAITGTIVFFFTLFVEMEYHGGVINQTTFSLSILPALIAAITTVAVKLGINLPTTTPTT